MTEQELQKAIADFRIAMVQLAAIKKIDEYKKNLAHLTVNCGAMPINKEDSNLIISSGLDAMRNNLEMQLESLSSLQETSS